MSGAAALVGVHVVQTMAPSLQTQRQLLGNQCQAVFCRPKGVMAFWRQVMVTCLQTVTVGDGTACCTEWHGGCPGRGPLGMPADARAHRVTEQIVAGCLQTQTANVWVGNFWCVKGQSSRPSRATLQATMMAWLQ